MTLQLVMAMVLLPLVMVMVESVAEKKGGQVVNDCSAAATTLALGAWGQNQTTMMIMIDNDHDIWLFCFDDGVDYDNNL